MVFVHLMLFHQHTIHAAKIGNIFITKNNKNAKYYYFLVRALPSKNNISDDTPKVFPIGTERMFQIGL